MGLIEMLVLYGMITFEFYRLKACGDTWRRLRWSEQPSPSEADGKEKKEMAAKDKKKKQR
jgi:hypothetical protein